MDSYENAYINDTLNRAFVPPLQHPRVCRENELNQLVHQIKQCANAAEDGKNWLVLHGPPGTGKTKLLVQALRCVPEIMGHFCDIIWINDNTTEPTRAITVFSDLYFSMASLLDGDIMSTAKLTNETVLRDHVTRMSALLSKGLIVIDGVYLKSVVDFLISVKCTVIFTTCSTDIFESVRHRFSDDYSFYRLGSFLSTNEVVSLAEAYSERITENQAIALSSNCLFNVALLGKLLAAIKKHSHMKRSVLDNDDPKAFVSFKISSSYPFASLEEAINVMYESLDKSVATAFEVCAALPPAYPIPIDGFIFVWPVDFCGNESRANIMMEVTEDIMQLADNNLLEPTELDKWGNSCYRIHPMLQSYLFWRVNRTKPRMIEDVHTTISQHLESLEEEQTFIELHNPEAQKECVEALKTAVDKIHRKSKNYVSTITSTNTVQTPIVQNEETPSSSSKPKRTIWYWIRKLLWFLPLFKA
uniref:NB-ARC domain-containing protein n=1 Tax=Panagrellus redivivus TaxID=6233 RepID=A0A7E4W4Y9_PANRE